MERKYYHLFFKIARFLPPTINYNQQRSVNKTKTSSEATFRMSIHVEGNINTDLLNSLNRDQITKQLHL